MIAGKPFTFALDAHDDQADPKTATAVAQRFIDRRPRVVIRHQNSGMLSAVARLCAAANIAELTQSATNPQFAHLGYRTTFRMIANDSFLDQVVAHMQPISCTVHRVGVVNDRTAYGGR